MSTAVSTQVVGQQEDWDLVEKLIGGDFSSLSKPDQWRYYNIRCNALGLDPYGQQMLMLKLSSRLTLYLTKSGTEQLARNQGISVHLVRVEIVGQVVMVTAQATCKDGRVMEALGAVSIAGLGGEALANATMKASTKGCRRAILAACAAGAMDESEAEDIPGAVSLPPPQPPTARPNPHNANLSTGEIPARQLAAGRPAPQPQAPPVEQPTQATQAQMEQLQGLLDTWEAMTGKKILPPEDAYAPVVLKWIAAYEKRIAAYELPAPVAATPAPVPQLVAVGAPEDADESPF